MKLSYLYFTFNLLLVIIGAGTYKIQFTLKSNDEIIQETMAQTREEKQNSICKKNSTQSRIGRENSKSQSIKKYPPMVIVRENSDKWGT